MSELHDLIVNKYTKTDKHRGFNSHQELYDEILTPYKHTAEKVFEIGINNGHSHGLWAEFFPNAHIYGVDIRRATLKRRPADVKDRITFRYLDQSNKIELEEFGKNYGPFDIIIDDGSHIWEHQILTFETLWKHLKPNGLFIIEDTLTSYPKHWPKRVQQGITCVEYFKKFVDEQLNINGEEVRNDDFEIQNLNEMQKTVKYVLFRTNSIVIKKNDRTF